MEFANAHPMLRAWAIEGTGGHGAGPSRHLLHASGIVIELDRPNRALSVLLTARRSAVNASAEAQPELFSPVIAAPEPIRVRF